MVSLVVLWIVMPSTGGLDAPADSNATTATGDVPILQEVRIGLLTTAKPEGDAGGVARVGLVVSGAERPMTN